MSDFNVDYDCVDAENDIVGKNGELWLTWSDFWEEIKEARRNCLNESMFKSVVENIIKYYNVSFVIDDIQY